ncbi:MAG: hypothetical protein M3340_09210 [Actinomycetota bacterium]|nr:hypothetical protein [Actinomycetota bacterium]
MARLALVSAAICLLAAIVPTAASARPGDVDASFGTGGQTIFSSQPGARSTGLVGLPDGKLLLAGGELALGHLSGQLARFTADGAIDPTFSSAALPSTFGAGGDPVVLGDGRIVVAGAHTEAGQPPGPSRSSFAAMRLLADGRPDPTFGTNGLAVVSGGGDLARSSGAIVQADGRIVLLGMASPPGGSGDWGAAAARLTPDGALDESFDGDGWARLEVPGSSGLVYEGRQAAGGKLLIAGEFDRKDTQQPDYHWTLIRLEPDGSKDATFDDDGVSQPSFHGQGGTFSEFAVDAAGRLLLAGGALQGGTHGWGISRATPDGEPDPTFGDGGRVWMQPPGTDPANPLIGAADRVAVQEDGRIVVSGNRSAALDGTRLVSGWALARLLPDGRLDPDFGDAGWSTTAMGFGDRLWPSGLVRTPEGKVVMSGEATECGHGAIALVRFHAENDDAGSADDAGPAMRTCDPVVEAEPDGDLPIEVGCPFTEDVCRGTGVVEIPNADVVVGRKSFKLRGARSGTIRVRASRRARRYIAHPRGVRAQVVYTTKDGEGHRRVTRRKLRLKRAG